MTIDTDLKSKSPITAAFIDGYLAAKGGGELAGIGKAAKEAEKKYGINAVYIVAHAAHETGWGRSRIAKEKNNLFGWSAFDKTPYSSAKGFPDKASCIDFVMGRIAELYLNPNGKYFRRAACLGHGKRGTAYGMNANYATDPDWGAKIARIADGIEKAFGRTRAA